jgi:ribosomal protein L19
MTINVKLAVFWDVPPCGSEEIHRCFGGEVIMMVDVLGASETFTVRRHNPEDSIAVSFQTFVFSPNILTHHFLKNVFYL